jgi:hypothetical protein
VRTELVVDHESLSVERHNSTWVTHKHGRVKENEVLLGTELGNHTSHFLGASDIVESNSPQMCVADHH